MRANGNGAPNVCASNLLRLIRGEVPYERIKGLDPRMIIYITLTGQMPLCAGVAYREYGAEQYAIGATL